MAILDAGAPRKPRADSVRNRERLLRAAKRAFTSIGAEVALEEVARRAGVGIGTLYRHFPTREALLAAVYRREVAELVAAADQLLTERPAGAALEAWLHQLVDCMATKRVIAPALQALPGEGATAYAAAKPALEDAMLRLTRAAIASGDIRADVDPDDLVRVMTGLSQGSDRDGWAPSTRRLITILMAGLRAPG